MSAEKKIEFLNFIGEEGIQFKDTADFEKRRGLWKKTDDLITAEKGKGYSLKHNKFSVLTDEEKQQILTLQTPLGRQLGRRQKDSTDSTTVDCGAGFYYNSKRKQCYPCSQGCSKCSSATKC